MLLAQPVWAAPPDSVRVLDLDVLLREARSNNPTLQAAYSEAQAAATRPRQVSALPDPSVSVGYRPFAVNGVEGIVPPQVMAQQMIPYPGKLALAGRAAGYGALMAEREADAMSLDLALQIREAYYELFRIQEQDRLIQSFQDQLGHFEEAAAVKYEVGQGMQQAILKAQLERTRLARKRLELKAARRDRAERLARLTNRPSLVSEPEKLVLIRPEPAALEADLLRRPEIDALQAGIRMAETETELARKAFRPDFMVGAGFMDMMGMNGAAEPLQNLGSRFGIEVGVVIPLQRGKRTAALEEARYRRMVYEERLEALRTEIETEINALRSRLEQDDRALALFRTTLIPQAETTLEATLSAYTTGKTDFLDLLDAQRMLFELEMDVEETYADYMKTSAALERTLGTEPSGFGPAQQAGLTPAP